MFKYVLIIIVIIFVAGCGTKIRTATYYSKYDKNCDEIKSEILGCDKYRSHDIGYNLVFSVSDKVVSEYEFIECINSKGLKPLFQFVAPASNDVHINESIATCHPELKSNPTLAELLWNKDLISRLLDADMSLDVEIIRNVESFIKCMAKNEWLLVTQPPWYLDRQNIERLPLMVPRGEWKPLAESEKVRIYYDPNKVENKAGIVRAHIIQIYKDDNIKYIPRLTIEINCKDTLFREVYGTDNKYGIWHKVITNTIGMQYKQKLCN